jgi:hypothetical protein
MFGIRIRWTNVFTRDFFFGFNVSGYNVPTNFYGYGLKPRWFSIGFDSSMYV